MTLEFPSLSDCAIQELMPLQENADTFNSDGTPKSIDGGFRITDSQRQRSLAIFILIITAIVLELLICILMSISIVRKHRNFGVLFIIFNVVSVLLLIAAVASAADFFLRNLGPCIHRTDFSNEQIGPSPTRPRINGFLPSSGGYRPNSFGRWRPVQSGNAAVTATFSFTLGSGAALLISAIVLLFIFSIIFGIKTNWTDVSHDAMYGHSQHPQQYPPEQHLPQQYPPLESLPQKNSAQQYFPQQHLPQQPRQKYLPHEFEEYRPQQHPPQETSPKHTPQQYLPQEYPAQESPQKYPAKQYLPHAAIPMHGSPSSASPVAAGAGYHLPSTDSSRVLNQGQAHHASNSNADGSGRSPGRGDMRAKY
jgi:hypothetical protein